MTTTSVTSSATSQYTETSGNTLLVESGGSVTSTTVDSGGSLVVSGGVETSATILFGGTETVSKGSATGDLIYGTATGVTGNVATFTSATVENGGTLDVLNSNSAVSTTVLSGGTLVLNGANGAVTGTVLSGGGTVELDSPKATLTGSLTFEGGGNTLDLASVVTTSAGTFGEAAVMSGFSSTDKIDVTAFAAATLSFATSGGNDVVTISSTSGKESLIFSGASYTSSTLEVVSSGGREYIEYNPDGFSSSGATTTSVTTSTASGAYTETSGNTLLVLSGGSVSAATIDNGGFLTVNGGVDNAATISAGGLEMVSAGSASDDLIYGTVSTVSGGAGVFTSETVENGGTFNLLNGNSAASTTVLSGGLFLISGNNASVTGTVLSGGGTLELDSPKANIAGSLTFEGGGNTLDIAVVADSGEGDLATISGFSTTDKINVTALGASPTLSVAASGGNDVVTVSGGSGSETFIFSGTTTYTSATLSVVSSGGQEYVEYNGSGGSTSGTTSTTSVTTSTASGAYTETSGNTLLVLSGGTVSAAIIDNGGFLTVSGGADISATISAGGSETVQTGSATADQIYGNVTVNGAGAAVSGETVESGGLLFVNTGGNDVSTTILSGGNETLYGSASGDQIYGTQLLSASTAVATGETVHSGGNLNLFLKGAVASATTVMSGGALNINGAAFAIDTVLDGGGILDLQSPKAEATGSLTFEGGGNTLEFTDITSAGHGVLATISGFSSSDKIDITSSAYAFSSLTLSQTVSGGGTVAEVFSGGSVVETFTFADPTLSGQLGLVSDGNGGADLEIVPVDVTTSVTTSTASGAYTEMATDTLLVLSGGSVSAATIDAGGFLTVNGGADVAATILSGGVETISAGTASGDQIYGSAIVSGGTVSNETVLSGGVFAADGGSASDITLSGGGTVEVATATAALVGSLTFAGGDNTLQASALADDAAHPAASYGVQAVISGFSTSDKIDVTDISPNGATLSFATNSAGDEVATIAGSGGSESFVFNDPTAYNSSTMSLMSDGSGGVDLIKDTTPVVTFTSMSGLQTNQATYTVNGTVDTAVDPEAIGTTVSILEGKTVVGTGTVGANGYWSADVSFQNDDGGNVLTASDTDGAGNTGVSTQSLTYDVDTTAAAFTAGNLVISVYGDGAGTGTYTLDQAAPITLEQITTSGQVVSQIVLPETTTTVNGVTENAISGEYGSASEGSLQLSADGHSLTIAGYGVNDAAFDASSGASVYGTSALGQTTSVSGGSATVVPRVVADINADGFVDTSTALTGVYNENNPRSVVTVDGSSFYLSGQGVKGDTTQGVKYALDGASTATSINSATDTRVAEIYNGQLYVSADTTQGATNISSYGALPTTATSPIVLNAINKTTVLNSATINSANAADIGQTVNLSPESFFFANSTTLYVADGGVPKNGGLGDGGLQKWVDVNGTWTLQYTLSAGLNLVPNTNVSTDAAGDSNTTGLIGLTGQVESNGTVELFATNEGVGELDQTSLYSITDTLAATTPAPDESFSLVMTAGPDQIIRGIAFAPTAYAPKITGTVADQATANDASLKPFSGVTIADANAQSNANVVDTLTITVGGSGGVLADGAGFSGLSATGAEGVYTLAGTLTAVSAELDALVFTPAAGVANTSSKSTFTLSDVSSANATPTVDYTTSVIDTDAAVAPTISDVVAGAEIVSGTVVTPFAGVTIADANGGTTETLSIQLTGSGALADGSGFSGLVKTSTAGLYTLTGTASAVTEELDALVFKPTSIASKSVATTTFSLSDTTSAETSASLSLSLEQFGDGNVALALNGSNNEVVGGNGNDTVSGGAGNNSVTLGNGNDKVQLAGSGDSITVGIGNDTITLSGANDVVTAGPTGYGNDVVTGGTGNATVTLGNGNDTITLGGTGNVITVGSGNDTIVAGSGADTVEAGNGNDKISLAGTGNVVNAGLTGSGNDVVSSGAGSDTISLGDGNNNVQAGGLNNVITVGSGNNTIVAGSGGDTVTVNGGRDTITFAGASNQANIFGSAVANISDLGSALTLDVGSSRQIDTISGLGTDSSWLLDFTNGAGGFGSVTSVMDALHSDGHGGTLLSLGSGGSIDFVKVAESQIHAANFKVG
jgi:autotransporter passenger strand-loop-strand repeat protein